MAYFHVLVAKGIYLSSVGKRISKNSKAKQTSYINY